MVVANNYIYLFNKFLVAVTTLGATISVESASSMSDKIQQC